MADCFFFWNGLWVVFSPIWPSTEDVHHGGNQMKYEETGWWERIKPKFTRWNLEIEKNPRHRHKTWGNGEQAGYLSRTWVNRRKRSTHGLKLIEHLKSRENKGSDRNQRKPQNTTRACKIAEKERHQGCRCCERTQWVLGVCSKSLQ